LSLALAFGARLGALGAWTGATIYIIALSGVLFARFKSNRWHHLQIFSDAAGLENEIPNVSGQGV
jgi:hypothetical protein